MTVEKNDVDISKLFIWGKKFEIKDAQDEVKAVVYMRLLGDADINRARVHALRKSRELRLKLQNPESDERLIYIRNLEELSKEDLINYVVVFSMREITQNAYKEVKVPHPKMPKSNAKLEAMEKYQKEVDDYPDKLNKAITEYIKKETDKMKKFLAEESNEALYKRYVESLIDEFCEQEALRAYNDIETYLGCYRDEEYTEKFFKNLEQFENLPTDDKLNFRAAYQTLHIGMDDLKKLQEATQ